MSQELFEKSDGIWKKRLRALREKRVPEGILKGFSASVERRLRSKEENAPAASPRPFWLALKPAVPVFAVLLIASAIVWRYPLWQHAILESPASVQVAAAVSDIAEEISALKAMEVWTDDDDRLIANPEESILNDLEFENPE